MRCPWKQLTGAQLAQEGAALAGAWLTISLDSSTHVPTPAPAQRRARLSDRLRVCVCVCVSLLGCSVELVGLFLGSCLSVLLGCFAWRVGGAVVV